MDKLLVNVYVPILNSSYDMFIPREASLGETLELMKKAVAELSDGLFFPEKNTVICRRESGEILNINLSVFELEIHNGSKLMLI